MKIKNTILTASAVALTALMSSCNMDNNSTQYFNVSLCNLVIPADADAEVTAQSKVNYKVLYHLGNGTATVTSDAMNIGGKSISLTSDPMKFSERISTSGYARNFSGNGSMSDGTAVTGLTGFESTLFYYYPTVVPGIVGVTPITNCVGLKYNVGSEYEVKTFGQDMYFAGETVTHFSMPDAPGQSFSYKESIYRIVFSDDLSKATVVIYNAKFAPQAPTLTAVCLTGLEVKLNRNGYDITGENVIPKVLETDGVTEYQHYIFNKFSFQSAGDMLTKCVCSYTVAGSFQGAFEGAYVLN